MQAPLNTAAMSDSVSNSDQHPGGPFRPGHAKWGGRPKGTTNNKVALRRERLAEAERVANVMIGDYPDGDMHTFLQMIVRNGAVPLASRIECAKIVYATERAKLAAISIDDPAGDRLAVVIRDMRAERTAISEGATAILIEHRDAVVQTAIAEVMEQDENDSD